MTPFDTLQQLRPTYPTPMSEADRADLLNRTAWAHRADGYGLLSKDGGSFVTLPNGTKIAQDILFHLPSGIHYDCLSDAEGAAIPSWQDKGPMDLSRWIAPLSVTPTPVPPEPEPPTPVPPPVDYGEWLDHDIPALVDAYRAKNGHEPGDTDVGHWGWRRFVEKWPLDAMLKDI